MIEPTGLTEQMMYCTVRIVGHIADTSNSKTGTGFFYNFPLAGAGQSVPVAASLGATTMPRYDLDVRAFLCRF
jgi:hypothetical protein